VGSRNQCSIEQRFYVVPAYQPGKLPGPFSTLDDELVSLVVCVSVILDLCILFEIISQ
jgi:hypothetical protein